MQSSTTSLVVGERAVVLDDIVACSERSTCQRPPCCRLLQALLQCNQPATDAVDERTSDKQKRITSEVSVSSPERGADLHMAQLMPLPLTVSCSRKIQIGFIFLVPAHLGSPGKRAVKRVCVRVCIGKQSAEYVQSVFMKWFNCLYAARCGWWQQQCSVRQIQLNCDRETCF